MGLTGGRQGLQGTQGAKCGQSVPSAFQHLDGQAVSLAEGGQRGGTAHKRFGAAGRGRAWAGAGAISESALNQAEKLQLPPPVLPLPLCLLFTESELCS